MAIDQKDKLLTKSTHLYLNRKFSEAKAIAEEVLQQSKHDESHIGLLRSSLLLGQICTTQGRFEGKDELYVEALKHLEFVISNEGVCPHRILVHLYITLAEIHQNKKEFPETISLLKKALVTARTNKDLFPEVHALCAFSQFHIGLNEFTVAQNFATQALNLLEQLDTVDEALGAEVYHQLGMLCVKQQDFAKIQEYGQKVLNVAQHTGDIEKEVVTLNSLGIYQGVDANYKMAMQYFLEALEKAESVNFRQYIALNQINIGTIYANLYNHEEALLRYQKLLNSFSDQLDSNAIIILNNNIGNIYYNTDRPELARQYFEKGMQLAQQNKFKEMAAQCMAQLSRTEVALEEFDVAMKRAQEAQKLLDKLGNVNGRQINLINLAHINCHLGNFDEAIELTNAGIEAAKGMKDDTSQIRGYRLLANIYRELNEFEKALEYQTIYSEAQDQFAKEQGNRKSIDLEIQYAIKSKQKEIELLTKENDYQGLLLQQSDQIKSQNDQLIEVNKELRQFAYVASHDLKEPLRMIGSFTQLIERAHKSEKENNSEDLDQYFGFVNEGVTRMNKLLDDLLQYATIGKSADDRTEVDLNMVVEIIMVNNLRILIEETGTTITASNLPVIEANMSLMIQLFQNLVSNAIKFRKPDVQPNINIGYEDSETEHILRIKDNGIGIEDKHKDRIFVIFQRLHSRQEYEGTGIGLAICQKIVKGLGGRIWFESVYGEGCTFFIGIPKIEDEL